MRALAPDPAARFATMRDLQVALESYARRAGLALSTVSLAGLMAQSFAAEIAAWHAAQRAGKTLGDHLAARPAAAAPTAGERTATDAFATSAGRRRSARVGRAAAVVALVGAFALAGGLARQAPALGAEPPDSRHGAGTASRRARPCGRARPSHAGGGLGARRRARAPGPAPSRARHAAPGTGAAGARARITPANLGSRFTATAIGGHPLSRQRRGRGIT